MLQELRSELVPTIESDVYNISPEDTISMATEMYELEADVMKIINNINMVTELENLTINACTENDNSITAINTISEIMLGGIVINPALSSAGLIIIVHGIE